MMPERILVCLLSLSPLLASAQSIPDLPKDTLAPEIQLDVVPIGLEEPPAPPAENPLTIERVRLGRRLFFDPVLSGDGTVSCASCHRPDHGFATPDTLAVGIGGKVGRRNSPTLLNRAYGRVFFWDGRAGSLEEQAVQPIINEVELGNTYPALLRSLRSDPAMVSAFTAAFGTPVEGSAGPVTIENVGRALAAFQRTLRIGNSPVDQFQTGNHAAMTTQERQGFWLFESRGGCWQCHSGRNYSDESFHNTGVSYGSENRDPGRFEVTQRDSDRFRFKTPTLRGVAHTAPYMHDGSQKTLRDVVEFYNKGAGREDPQLDGRIRPLGLNEAEVANLAAFLGALSREASVQAAPSVSPAAD